MIAYWYRFIWRAVLWCYGTCLRGAWHPWREGWPRAGAWTGPSPGHSSPAALRPTQFKLSTNVTNVIDWFLHKERWIDQPIIKQASQRKKRQYSHKQDMGTKLREAAHLCSFFGLLYIIRKLLKYCNNRKKSSGGSSPASTAPPE